MEFETKMCRGAGGLTTVTTVYRVYVKPIDAQETSVLIEADSRVNAMEFAEYFNRNAFAIDAEVFATFDLDSIL
jgi:hypothetical protein